MIDKKRKSAHGAATPMSTLLNKQDQYNTDRQKSEIRKTAIEVFDLSLRLQEMTDGTRLDRLARARCSVCIR